MPLDAIISIRAAEDEAVKAKLDSQQKAQDAIDAADKSGEEAVAATLARAEAEIAAFKRAADQMAESQAIELASSTANRQATLRARAERRLDSAASLIVERIVDF